MLTSILFDWRVSLRSIGLSRWLIYKCRSVNIRTISPPMFRSCSLVSQTPVKLGSQSRTWSQRLADRQMPKSWVSAKSDPAIMTWHSTLPTVAERSKQMCHLVCIIIISRIFYKRPDRLILTFKLKWPSNPRRLTKLGKLIPPKTYHAQYDMAGNVSDISANYRDQNRLSSKC